MVVGSALNWVTDGAGGFAGAGATGVGAGGGGAATGAFFLQPAANTAKLRPTPAIRIFCLLLLHMNFSSSFHANFGHTGRGWAGWNYFPHTGL
jgi:hypothetical protein